MGLGHRAGVELVVRGPGRKNVHVVRPPLNKKLFKKINVFFYFSPGTF